MNSKPELCGGSSVIQRTSDEDKYKLLSDRHTKRHSLFELAVGYGLILLVVWTPRPWQQGIYLVAAVYLTVVTWLRYRGLGAMGVRAGGLLRSSWIVGVAGVLAAATVFAAYRRGGLNLVGVGVGGPMDFMRRYWGYAIWAFLQQVLLQDFFLRRLLCLMPGRPVLAAGAAAGIFAFAHLPNPILAPVTLLWGFMACLLFLRYRNLWPLAVVHALFGITLSVAMPPTVIRGMRVGLGYVHHSAHRPVRGVVLGGPPQHWTVSPERGKAKADPSLRSG